MNFWLSQVLISGARWKLDIPIELIRDPFKQSEDHQLNDEAARFDTDVAPNLPDPFKPCTRYHPVKVRLPTKYLVHFIRHFVFFTAAPSRSQ